MANLEPNAGDIARIFQKLRRKTSEPIIIVLHPENREWFESHFRRKLAGDEAFGGIALFGVEVRYSEFVPRRRDRSING